MGKNSCKTKSIKPTDINNLAQSICRIKCIQKQSQRINKRYGLRPKNGYLYTQLAAAYKIQGQIEQAAEVYIDALQQVGLTRNQRETIWSAMLEIYESDHYKPIHNKLVTELEKRRSRDPRNPNIIMTLGELFFHAGKVSQALETFKQLHRNYPTYTDMTLEKYGQVLERNENPQAVDFYKALIAGSTDRTRIRNAHSKLAALYQKMEQWNDAIAVLEDLVSNREASVKNILLLGQLQLHGIHAPKVAQKTFQSLLTQRLPHYRIGRSTIGAGRMSYPPETLHTCEGSP